MMIQNLQEKLGFDTRDQVSLQHCLPGMNVVCRAMTSAYLRQCLPVVQRRCLRVWLSCMHLHGLLPPQLVGPYWCWSTQAIATPWKFVGKHNCAFQASAPVRP